MSAYKKISRLGFIIFGALVVVTGVFKFLEAYHIIGFVAVRQYWINLVHDWSGIAVVFLSLINMVLRRVKLTAGKMFGLRTGVWILIVFIILAGAVIYYIAVGSPQNNTIEQLSKSQVTEYQGQKLSPIGDIQDNAINGTQRIDIAKYSLEVSGLVQTPENYTYEQVLNFKKYQKVVELDCVEGWKANILWEGILVKDLLAGAGIKPQAKVVIFYASDGYTTSLPLDYIENNNILLADKMNGIVIPPEKGFPFQLVAEQKWGYKWIKWITKIELSDDINYQGTWEKAGYNNNGDVSGPKSAQ